jgi:phosphoadenosine phosphosulfate reductase
MTQELQKKVEQAIKLIQSAGKIAKEHGQPLEICYSGGKDSDVILELAKMSGVEYRAIYKNTTIDSPYTIQHAKQKGVEIAQPKMTFRQIIEKRGIPSRMRRFCCEILKEYKISDYAVVGVRRDESKARAERYHEPEQCRVYNNKEKARLYYPLLDFTANDIADFVEERGIKCHPLYYDENGNFLVERRLGCMGCPLVTPKQRIKEFKEHSGMVKLYIKAAQVFFDNHPNSKMREYIDNAVEWFVMSIYCKSIEDFKQRFKTDNLFGERIDCKAFVEQEFGISL